jgi:hypothetical protein
MDIMLDLETLGTKPGCVVLSIGAKVFDPYGNDSAMRPPTVPPLPSFYRNIDLFASLMLGLTIDPATVEWWRKKDADAQEALLAGKVTPQKAVQGWEEWYSGQNQARAPSDLINIWAKSPGFDCHVWEHVAGLVMAVPLAWDFRRFRDVRTLVSVSGIDEKSITAKGTGRTQHNALDDCDVQILQVQAAYRALGKTPAMPAPAFPIDPLARKAAENG